MSRRRGFEFWAKRIPNGGRNRGRVAEIWRACRLSQAVFAVVLNTSLSTVQKWETGAKRPGGPSLKLLNLIERKGLNVVL